MKKLMALTVFLIPLVSFAGSNDLTKFTDVHQYAERTAKDYCGTSMECKIDFSQKILWAYKDGEAAGKSRFKNETLLKRYEEKWYSTECAVAPQEDKDKCYSMVYRLSDAYNRGLSTR